MGDPFDAHHSAGAFRPSTVEPRWQDEWRAAGVFATPPERPGAQSAFVLVSCPFTSGAAHMGHVRSYSIGDAYARYRRAQGDDVLFSLGFDAFGLPAELGAIAHDMTPRAWVDDCVSRMRAQFDRLGFSFDWSRVFASCDDDIYRWSQWLFLVFRGSGLMYQKEATVDWCPACDTVLARSQADGGECWRCHGPVRLVRRAQWFLRLSAYNNENDEHLAALRGWNRGALDGQASALGRVDGYEHEIEREDGRRLRVFRSAADDDGEPPFVMLSPNHPEIAEWVDGPEQREALLELRDGGWQRSDRAAGDVVFLPTTQKARVGPKGLPIPVVISPAVDQRFGPTAIFGSPRTDRTHAVIAKRLGLIDSCGPDSVAPAGVAAVRYRAGDFPVSRQRAWGAPIPLIHCPDCGTVGVPLEDLPVRLPDDLNITGGGNVLADHPSFASCLCPSCGGPARRETDTLDCHFDASWQHLPLAVTPTERAQSMFGNSELRRWLPVSCYVQGADTAGFILDQRMVTKALRDLNELEFLPDGEPYGTMVTHEMVQFEGRKMSKHLGNVVSPQDLVGAVGADAVRFAVLYAAAPAKVVNWHEQVVAHGVAFVRRLWAFAAPRLSYRSADPCSERDGTADTFTLASVCARYAERITEDYQALNMHRASRNVSLLLTEIENAERAGDTSDGDARPADASAVRSALLLLLRLAAPLVPHIAEELWERAGQDGLLTGQPWPEPSLSTQETSGAHVVNDAPPAVGL